MGNLLYEKTLGCLAGGVIGDAMGALGDHYHRYEEDLKILKDMGVWK